MAAARYSVVLAFATIVLCQLLPGLAADALSFTVLSWNVHWQCGSDHLPGCRAAATQRFVDLSKQHSANVVVAVELEHNASAPIDLPSHGLTAHGWTQVNGSCPGAGPGKTGDALGLAIGPGWEIATGLDKDGHPVLAAGGGCLGGNAGSGYKADARAFAVALAKPPAPGVQGCETGICLVGLHAPHNDITLGADVVARVCGEARHNCTVAAGDWNAPFSKQPFCEFTVADRWGQLLGSPPSRQGLARLAAAPDENTCCFPESKYHGWMDHAVTNVPGGSITATALGYQMSAFGADTEEHKPIVAAVSLPTPFSDRRAAAAMLR